MHAPEGKIISMFSVCFSLAGGKGCYYHVPAALATQKEENEKEDERQRERECLSSVNFKVAAGTTAHSNLLFTLSFSIQKSMSKCWTLQSPL